MLVLDVQGSDPAAISLNVAEIPDVTLGGIGSAMLCAVGL